MLLGAIRPNCPARRSFFCAATVEAFALHLLIRGCTFRFALALFFLNCGVTMKLKIAFALLACLISCGFSSVAVADGSMDDPALASPPIALTEGKYICTYQGGTVKMEVTAALEFTFDGVSYTQSDGTNGGNGGEIKFSGKIGKRDVEMIVTTSTGGLPPYKLKSPTADGGYTTYECVKVG
jgi:hypothetical protein